MSAADVDSQARGSRYHPVEDLFPAFISVLLDFVYEKIAEIGIDHGVVTNNLVRGLCENVSLLCKWADDYGSRAYGCGL
jgi:hypothetical protein